MAKAAKFNGGRTKTVLQGPKGGGKRPELPVNKTESNASADKQSMVLFSALAAGTVLLFATALVWGASLIVGGITASPNWIAILSGFVIVSTSIFIVRSLAWLSFFASIMYAFKSGAWKTQEHLCRVAARWWRFFPGGGSTAATLLVQSLVNRGEFEEALSVGEEQFQIHAGNPKAAQNLAGMYVTLGMAAQMRGESKSSISWNERAIEALLASIEELTTKKSWFSRLAGGQAKEWTGSLRTQLAVATFNNATAYFNTQNHRQSKAQYKKALEYANLAPDFPEKRDLTKVCSDQLSRLKHT